MLSRYIYWSGKALLMTLVAGVCLFWLIGQNAALAASPLEETIEKIFFTKVPVANLDPIIIEALSKVRMELPADMQDLAIKCWKKQVCETGHGDLIVGIADGFGDNVWRQFSHMEIILQSLAYPEIKKIIYTNAHGKLEDAIANMRGLIVQDVDIIVGYFDFGAAMFPVMEEAIGRGIAVVPYTGGMIGGKAGKDYTTQVNADLSNLGAEHANLTIRTLGEKGTAVLLTGTPGNPQGEAWHSAAEKVFAKYPGWRIVKADTYWTQQGAFKAMSGLLAAEKEIDIIHYDYANATRGVVRAYEQAGKQLPMIATWTADNGLFSDWERLKPTNPNFRLFFTTGLNWNSRVALTAAINKKKGKTIPGKINFAVPFVEIKKGVYDPSKPDEFGGSELVPPGVIKRMFPIKK